MAKTDSTAKANSTKWHFFSNPPKYLPAKISSHTVCINHFICIYRVVNVKWAWKWQPEKKNHNLAPELAAYTLTQSFNASHQCDRDSPTPNCRMYTICGRNNCNWLFPTTLLESCSNNSLTKQKTDMQFYSCFQLCGAGPINCSIHLQYKPLDA